MNGETSDVLWKDILLCCCDLSKTTILLLLLIFSLTTILILSLLLLLLLNLLQHESFCTIDLDNRGTSPSLGEE